MLGNLFAFIYKEGTVWEWRIFCYLIYIESLEKSGNEQASKLKFKDKKKLTKHYTYKRDIERSDCKYFEHGLYTLLFRGKIKCDNEGYYQLTNKFYPEMSDRTKNYVINLSHEDKERFGKVWIKTKDKKFINFLVEDH